MAQDHLMSPSRSPQDAPQLSPQQLAGSALKTMREIHGISLRGLARAVGVTPGHMSRVEKGERAAGPDLEKRILAIFTTAPREQAS